jgi:hypothetical protein
LASSEGLAQTVRFAIKRQPAFFLIVSLIKLLKPSTVKGGRARRPAARPIDGTPVLLRVYPIPIESTWLHVMGWISTRAVPTLSINSYAVRCLLPRGHSFSKAAISLNAIKRVFAKLKHLLCNIATRTVGDACAAIGQILGTFAPDECSNYLENSGYALD